MNGAGLKRASSRSPRSTEVKNLLALPKLLLSLILIGVIARVWWGLILLGWNFPQYVISAVGL